MLNSGKMITWMVTVFTRSSPQTWTTSVRLRNSLGLKEKEVDQESRNQLEVPESVDWNFAPRQHACAGVFFRELRVVLNNLLATGKCCQDSIQMLLANLDFLGPISEVSYPISWYPRCSWIPTAECARVIEHRFPVPLSGQSKLHDGKPDLTKSAGSGLHWLYQKTQRLSCGALGSFPCQLISWQDKCEPVRWQFFHFQ